MERSVLLASLFLFPGSADACSVCLSPVAHDPTMIALRASVLCLLTVTLVILASFAKFFLSVRKRERLLR